MKKVLVLLVFSLLLGVAGFGQSFLRFYGPTNTSTVFNDCKRLVNGGYVAVGNFSQGTWTGPIRPLVVLYNTAGQVVREWSDTTISNQIFYSVVATSDGGFITVGNRGGSKNVYKFNGLGDTLWSISTPFNLNLQSADLTAIVETNNSSFILTCPITRSSSQDVFVAKIDQQGDTIWTYQWGNSLYDESPSDVISTSDGGYLIVGNYLENLNSYERFIFAIKLDSSGSESWIRTYLKDNAAEVVYSKVSEKSSGGYIVSSAFTDIAFQNRGLLLELDALGNAAGFLEPASNCKFYDFSKSPDGGYFLTGYLAGFEYFFEDSIVIVKLDDNLNEVWRKGYFTTVDWASSGMSVTSYQGNGMIVCGDWAGQAFIFKTDSLGRYPGVKGRIIADVDADCHLDAGDFLLQNHMVQIIGTDTFYGYSNSLGEFYVNVLDTGQAVLNTFSPTEAWENSPCQPNGISISLWNLDTLSIDIYKKPALPCTALSVKISTPQLRICIQSPYVVEYCNDGTLPIGSIYLEIELDPYLTVDSASIPWASNTGNLYRFNLDTVSIGQCGSFNLYVTVDCDSTELGQTHCVSAHIYPDSICLPPDPAWDGSSVKVTGKCDLGDTLDFTIENVGTADMAGPSFFLIAEDNVMYTSGQFQLNAGQIQRERIPGNGSTFTLIANQVEGHPGLSFPMVSIEGCGTNAQGTFSKGFVTQYPQDDQNGFVDILCLQNVGSYDPNDKRPEPLGLNAEGYITATQPLDYTVRFQNTGTDTAFTVVIRDTLSSNLDITTLRLNSSSHTYTFQIIGSNVLEWTFPNILLPDSNVNEPLSHGFVSFGINQTEGNAPGTEITNRAGIYFDFNAPIITNTTLNTVIEDYKTWFTFIQSPESKFQLGIYPNPNNGTFSLDFLGKTGTFYEFVVYDLAGAKQFGQMLEGNTPFVMHPELPNGMYLYQLLENGLPVSMGKVIVSK